MSTIRLLIKPALFASGFCGACFCGAAVYQYERSLSHKSYPQFSSPFKQVTLLKDRHNDNYFKSTFFEIREKVRTWKNQLRTGEKIAFVIISINLYVLISWRIPKLRPVMNKFFNSKYSPLDKKLQLSPMLLSCFSHASPVHFAFNMYCLYSFSNVATHLMGPEQFVALFLSAGVVSSFASLAVRVATQSQIGSIGASGALFGIVAYVCMKMPDSEILLFFIPIAAGNLIKGAMAFDAVGILAKWKLLDHAAHLGGSLFGVWYATSGEKLFYKYRRLIVSNYLECKKKLQ